MSWFWNGGGSSSNRQNSTPSVSSPVSSLNNNNNSQSTQDQIRADVKGTSRAGETGPPKHDDDVAPYVPDPAICATSRIGPSIAPLPETMICRQSFDEAMYCSFLGSHFNNVYRYGTMRECSGKWSDFWFCMRMRNYSGEEKAERIREHYREKEQKYVDGPSSEDVWEARTRPLKEAHHLDPVQHGHFEVKRPQAENGASQSNA